MIEEGQVVLFHFPKTDMKEGKLRPALVIRKVPGDYNDWLICMISSRIHQQTAVNDIIGPDADDYKDSGLKAISIIRVSRLAVVESEILIGKLGQISHQRLHKIKEKIAKWITGV